MEYHPKCTVIESRAATYLLTKLRQKDLGPEQFQIIGDRLMRLLGEEALARLPTVVEGSVETPSRRQSDTSSQASVSVRFSYRETSLSQTNQQFFTTRSYPKISQKVMLYWLTPCWQQV